MGYEQFPEEDYFNQDALPSGSFTEMVFAWQADQASHGAYTAWQATHQGDAPPLTYEVDRVKKDLIANGVTYHDADRMAHEAYMFYKQSLEEGVNTA